MTAQPKAFICGCKGFSLDAQERALLGLHQPWGLILFKRNIESPEQVAALVASFREIVGRGDAPVLIDQEGGRVQRMAPPHWPAYPPAARFGTLPGGRAAQVEAARLSARLMASDLAAVGINVDCLPVLDVPAPGSHAIVGDRAYGPDPQTVAALGRAVCEGMLAQGVLPVVKHIPGHGRAKADSHLELPRVEASRRELEEVDFAPFKALNDMPLGMTAHVVYAALDAERPGTTSPRVVNEIIRGFIGFDGLLMSDDLSMKALSGDFSERARAVFAAGLDMALHCNGDWSETEPVAKAAPMLEGRSLERAQRALALLEAPAQPLDLVDARARIHLMLAAGV
jgi:beta-N-acetylhexosaminidase